MKRLFICRLIIFQKAVAQSRLLELLLTGRKSVIDTEKTLEKVVSQSQITYDEIQLEAVRTAISSKVMILTGGPGTGKPLPHWYYICL